MPDLVTLVVDTIARSDLGKDKVNSQFDSDAEDMGGARPQLKFVPELDADVVAELSEG